MVNARPERRLRDADYACDFVVPKLLTITQEQGFAQRGGEIRQRIPHPPLPLEDEQPFELSRRFAGLIVEQCILLIGHRFESPLFIATMIARDGNEPGEESPLSFVLVAPFPNKHPGVLSEFAPARGVIDEA